MRKRRIPPLCKSAKLSGSTLLTLSLLTTSLLTFSPALASSPQVSISADAAKGGPSINITITPGQRGLSGQDATQPWATRTVTTGGLPETNLDSFVYQAGAMADQIYGDESVQGQPEFMEFGPTHRINAGIQGVNAAGLTTGHGSYMPSAWGRDEFISSGGEWYETGSGSYDFPADPADPGYSAVQTVSQVVSDVFAQLPNALSSTGTAGANGLGRVLGMPGNSSFNMTPSF